MISKYDDIKKERKEKNVGQQSVYLFIFFALTLFLHTLILYFSSVGECCRERSINHFCQLTSQTDSAKSPVLKDIKLPTFRLPDLIVQSLRKAK
jgi:hypothetical protein